MLMLWAELVQQAHRVCTPGKRTTLVTTVVWTRKRFILTIPREMGLSFHPDPLKSLEVDSDQVAASEAEIQ